MRWNGRHCIFPKYKKGDDDKLTKCRMSIYWKGERLKRWLATRLEDVGLLKGLVSNCHPKLLNPWCYLLLSWIDVLYFENMCFRWFVSPWFVSWRFVNWCFVNDVSPHCRFEFVKWVEGLHCVSMKEADFPNWFFIDYFTNFKWYLKNH